MDLSDLKSGDVLTFRMTVREVGIDGMLWFDDPFHRHNGRYVGLLPSPVEIVEVERKAPRSNLPTDDADPALCATCGKHHLPSGLSCEEWAEFETWRAGRLNLPTDDEA